MSSLCQNTKSQTKVSQINCTCNHAKTIDELILEHHRSIQDLMKSRRQEIEFLLNENKMLTQQQTGKTK